MFFTFFFFSFVLSLCHKPKSLTHQKGIEEKEGVLRSIRKLTESIGLNPSSLALTEL